jgi:hypothetical protein
VIPFSGEQVRTVRGRRRGCTTQPGTWGQALMKSSRSVGGRWSQSVEEQGLGDAGGAVAADVAGYLAAAGGVPTKIASRRSSAWLSSARSLALGVQVVAVPGPPGPAAATTVVGDGAIAV